MAKDLSETIRPDKQASYREVQQKTMRGLKYKAGELRREAADVIKRAAQKILDQAEVRWQSCFGVAEAEAEVDACWALTLLSKAAHVIREAGFAGGRDALQLAVGGSQENVCQVPSLLWGPDHVATETVLMVLCQASLRNV